MSSIIDFITSMNFSEWILTINGFLAASYALAVLIPGAHPDREIEFILNLTKKVSRK